MCTDFVQQILLGSVVAQSVVEHPTFVWKAVGSILGPYLFSGLEFTHLALLIPNVEYTFLYGMAPKDGICEGTL
jgi:hypothetical protein